MKILKGKTAIITGATRGIGRGIAKIFVDHGANVLFTFSSSSDLAKEIENELSNNDVVVKGFKSDASNYQDCQNLIDQITKEFPVIDILINNAGITRDNLLMRMKDDEWDDVINANLTGMFRITRLCLRPMMKAKYGKIINITSVVGLTGNPGQTNYAATKAGMIGFTQSLAKEVGSRGITVNAVAPGFIKTDMTDGLSDEIHQAVLKQIVLERLGDPDEIASVVEFLASPRADYITGQTISVNGGMYMG